MGRYHFAIQHQGKFHKCFLDEEGALWIPDKNGVPRAIEGPVVESPERAREVAMAIIREKEQ
jgi:hypothetical protein